MKILVTGGTGKVGSEVIKELCKRDVQVELCWNLGDAVIRRRSVLAC